MFRLTPYNTNGIVRRSNDFSDLYNLFDNVWNESLFTSPSLSTGGFKVDIRDTEGAFVLDAELPGITKEEVSVDYKDGLLTIKVEKEDSKDEDHNNYIYKERQHSSLQRVFKMKGVKREDLKAKLQNGILTVTAPKLDEVVHSYKVEIE